MINLKPADLEDRKKAYQWLYFSDFSSFLKEMDSSDSISTMQEFEEDYEDFFFDDSYPEKGRAYLIIREEGSVLEEIGFISYTAFHLIRGIAEIDIWLKSLEYTGRGYGREAIKLLTQKLFQEDFKTLIIRPCLKNVRAVNSYKKTGFKETSFKPEYYKREYIHEFAAGDCKDGEDMFMELKNSDTS